MRFVRSGGANCELMDNLLLPPFRLNVVHEAGIREMHVLALYALQHAFLGGVPVARKKGSFTGPSSGKYEVPERRGVSRHRVHIAGSMVPNQDSGGCPVFVVAWDPDILTPEEYRELIGSIADLVRAQGGLGLDRIRSQGFRVAVGAGVLA
jgi:hypothetical protein